MRSERATRLAAHIEREQQLLWGAFLEEMDLQEELEQIIKDGEKKTNLFEVSSSETRSRYEELLCLPGTPKAIAIEQDLDSWTQDRSMSVSQLSCSQDVAGCEKRIVTASILLLVWPQF